MSENGYSRTLSQGHDHGHHASVNDQTRQRTQQQRRARADASGGRLGAAAGQVVGGGGFWQSGREKSFTAGERGLFSRERDCVSLI